MERPTNWLAKVNDPEREEVRIAKTCQLESLRRSVHRIRPFGRDAWGPNTVEPHMSHPQYVLVVGREKILAEKVPDTFSDYAPPLWGWLLRTRVPRFSHSRTSCE